MGLDRIYWRVNGFMAVAGRPTGEHELLGVFDRWSHRTDTHRPHDRYVVWRVYRRPEDGEVIASAGHYTPSLADALQNMDAR